MPTVEFAWYVTQQVVEVQGIYAKLQELSPFLNLATPKTLSCNFDKVIGRWANQPFASLQTIGPSVQNARHGFAERPSAEMPPARSDAGDTAYAWNPISNHL